MKAIWFIIRFNLYKFYLIRSLKYSLYYFNLDLHTFPYYNLIYILAVLFPKFSKFLNLIGSGDTLIYR